MNQTFLQHIGNHSKIKEAYTDGSKSTGRKVGFDQYSRTSSEEGHYKRKKREDTRWVIYTDMLSSMLTIENNRENHSILNQIHDLLAELNN